MGNEALIGFLIFIVVLALLIGGLLSSVYGSVNDFYNTITCDQCANCGCGTCT